jgi:hypothetical protein
MENPVECPLGLSGGKENSVFVALAERKDLN